MNVLVPAVPKRLQITPTMVDDFVWDPCLAAWYFFRVKLDWFQRVRLKLFWFTPELIDSSGFTSGKTIVDWVYVNLRCLMLPESPAVVYYPSFETGKRTFWTYYLRISNPILRAHLGRLDEEGEEDGNSKSRGAGCYKAFFKNGSVLEMPALNIMKDAVNAASTRFCTSLFEEWTHIDAAGNAINAQLLGRNTKPSFGNQHHPLWTNHIKYTAPAKTQMHPAHARVKKLEGRVRAGNPRVGHIHFCYKDFSPGFTDAEGRSVRMQNAINTLRENCTESEWLGEGLGIWARNLSGWYSEADLMRCVELGAMAKLVPAASRAEDARRLAEQGFKETGDVKYFMGVDPAPSQSAKNDDGAIAILRARPIIDQSRDGDEQGRTWTDNAADYDCSWIYLKRLRDADAGEWSAQIVQLHMAFGLSKVLMDMGAAGGGLFIKKELAKPRQKIHGQEKDVTPILTVEDMGLRGHFILHAFKRSDPLIEGIWKGLAGDDVLLDMAHTEMRQAVIKALVKWPKRYVEWTQEEVLGLGEENLWSLKNLTGVQNPQGENKLRGSIDQFCNIGCAMKEDKETYELTRNGARQFAAVKGLKDFQMAMMLAWTGFLGWLRFDAGMGSMSEEESGMIW